MNLFRSIFFVLFFLCLFYNAGAQIRFTASISPDEIGLNDYATLRYTVYGSVDIQHIYPPDFKDVQIISGPDSESGKLDINGQVSKIFSFVFVIRPLKPGRINFEGARAKVSGKEYVSNEVVLHVSKTPNIRQTDAAKKMHDNDDELLHEGEDLDKKVNDNMVLRLETDKKEVYVGEPVVAGFKLYSRLRSSSRLTKNPSFNGFSVIDLQPPDVTASGSGKLNGKDFNVYTVRKVLLYPLQSGTFTIEELELENQVQFIQPGPPEDPDDLFSLLNPGYESTISKLATLTSEPVDIVVKPLPTRNKPSNFTGAVGKYKITSHLAQNNFQADEEGRLIVEISGQGNLQLVNAPPIQWPSGIEAFDPSVKDTMDTKVLPVSGKKTFEYVFSATRPGSYEIPAVTFSYFDAEAGRYVNTESDAMMITVSPSQKAIDKASVQKAETKRDSNNFIWFLIPGAIGAIALLFFIFRNLRREQKIIEPKDEQVGAPKQTSLVSESPLERSSQLCSEGDSKKFYPVLNHEFKSWLMAKFCLQVNEASLDHLRECMDEANVQNKLVLEVQDLLREIEWQLYAPAGEASDMHEHYTRASILVKELESRVKDA